MSALSQSVPRRPSQRVSSVEPAPVGGWIGVTHEQFALLRWVATTWTEHQILEKLMSLVNQRDARLVYDGKPKQGITKVLLTSELLDDLRCEIRMGQVALEKLLDDDEGPAAIRRVSRVKALEQGLVTRKEAGPQRDAYVYEILMGNWAQLADLHRQEWETAHRIQKKAKEPEPAPPIEEVDEHEPLILMPGSKSRPMRLPARVREALSDGVPMLTDFTGSSPIAVSFSFDGVIRCSISDASDPANREKRKKGERGAHSTAPARYDELKALLEPIWSEWLPGEPLGETVLLQISAALDPCPVDAIEGACYRRTLQVNFLKPPKLVTGGFFVWAAQQARKNWEEEQHQRPRVDAASKSNSERDLKMAQEVFRAHNAGDESVTSEQLDWAREVLSC